MLLNFAGAAGTFDERRSFSGDKQPDNDRVFTDRIKLKPLLCPCFSLCVSLFFLLPLAPLLLVDTSRTVVFLSVNTGHESEMWVVYMRENREAFTESTRAHVYFGKREPNDFARREREGYMISR